MNSIMLLVAMLFLFALILAFIKALSRREPSVWPFYPRKPLSPPEQILYFRLIKALPEDIVLAQVQLSRFLAVKKGNNFQSWLNRINRMSADFVICNKDASVLAVIELDDSSHNNKTRQQADAKKDKAISSAGLKIIRWNVKNMPDEQAIRNILVATA